MKIFSHEFKIETKSKFESIDITERIQETAKSIDEGVVYVFVKHTTCAIIVNEAEKGLMQDYLDWAKKLVPPEGEFKHNLIDNNGHAHIISSIIGNSRTVPVRSGNLDLGTWQRIILLEFDGPRTRTVNVKVMGE